MVSDRNVLDPLHYYSFTHRMHTWTASDARQLSDTHWRLRAIELDNRALADCQLPVRIGRRLYTRAKHRDAYRRWMDMVEFPRIAKGLLNIVLTDGQNADMEVRVRGSPDVTVRWLHNWLPLVESDHVYIRHYRPDEYVLTIRSARPRDRGLYTCVASNMAGTVRTTAQVDVMPRLEPMAIVEEAAME